MSKLILIAALSVLTTQAYAGGSRSLSLAATNATQQMPEQPATTAAVAPQATQPPANVQTATTVPASTVAAAPAATAAAPTTRTTETTKPKHRQPSTEARVIRELHRHGIYW
ncbi:hypothetical protein [Bradyrhizobium symbiodeficiens]|uniref:hypothetical protein n=1 Tax=Bradyrhizobium symbiodeficiens TaxID=1404367 RepID=UPI00140F9312|nr:hypothetical protein [Bradyrhizobium symbiodeficiens]QIP03191.1 hypothetical protein HAU86_26920 [Bradyrhizobium symbiodeficiens]